MSMRKTFRGGGSGGGGGEGGREVINYACVRIRLLYFTCNSARLGAGRTRRDAGAGGAVEDE